MFAIAPVLACLFASDAVLDVLPADRTRVPRHLPLNMTLDLWKRIDEGTAKKEIRWERELQRQERRELDEWDHTCALYRRWRVMGILRVPPDPPMPQPYPWVR